MPRVLLAVAALALVAADPAPPPARIVAHRGLLRHAPENTLANFDACLDLRLDIELDVRRTRDGQLVVIHDDTADRTTTGKGKVAALSLRELQALDAGAWFDPAFAGERVPTLDAVFAERFVPAAGRARRELFVAHGNVIRSLVVRALGVDPEAWLEMSVAHTSITEILVEADGRFKVISVGDAGHLPMNLRSGVTGVSDKSLIVP